MRRLDGFLLKLGAAMTLITAWAGCGDNNAPSPETTPSPSETARALPGISFEEIQLPQAKVSIRRESPSPTPNEILRLSVKIADDFQSRGQGLMRVQDLPPSSGMVFLYYRPTETSFYMKNTLIPLDIAFWGEDRKIHQIMQMRPCKAEPCPTYKPNLPFVGALEVEMGLLARSGVKIGDVVTVTAQTTGG